MYGRERSPRSDHQLRSGVTRRSGAGKNKEEISQDISQKCGSELLRRTSAGSLPRVRFPPAGAREDIPNSAEKEDSPSAQGAVYFFFFLAETRYLPQFSQT
jgi:hypothetical protein